MKADQRVGVIDLEVRNSLQQTRDFTSMASSELLLQLVELIEKVFQLWIRHASLALAKLFSRLMASGRTEFVALTLF